MGGLAHPVERPARAHLLGVVDGTAGVAGAAGAAGAPGAAGTAAAGSDGAVVVVVVDDGSTAGLSLPQAAHATARTAKIATFVMFILLEGYCSCRSTCAVLHEAGAVRQSQCTGFFRGSSAENELSKGGRCRA